MSAALRSAGFRIALGMLATGCAAGLVHVISVVGFHVPFDPNEGWNAYFAQFAMQTGSPYPKVGGLLVNNYPPLSFFLIGELARIAGDAIVVGRVVSALALIGLAAGNGLAARIMGCSRPQAVFAALLLVAALLLTSDYVGMDDPQLLGHAVSIWGLVAILRRPGKPRSLVLAALLFTLAFFIKHNLILLPMSLAAWLILADRRTGLTFIAAGTIFLLIGLGLFRDFFGTDLLRQLATPRIYVVENVHAALESWLPWAFVPLCFAVLLYLRARRDRHAVFAFIYVVIATIGGLFFASGAGVDANAMIDADIALALCAGLVLNRFESEDWSVFATVLYLAPLAILFRHVDGDWRARDYWLQPMAEERRVAASEIALLRATPNPVLCEMLSLCYWAGKTAEVDVFNIDQRIRSHAGNGTALVRLIEDKRFAMIELESLKPFPISGGAEQSLSRNYTIVRNDGGRVFLSPR